jgi:hypothetical protein
MPGREAISALWMAITSFPYSIPGRICGKTTSLMRGFVIEPMTAEGRVTARLLRLNIDQRLSERRAIGRS